MASSDVLSAKQVAFVSALLTESSIPAAAKAAGVAERTAYHWMGNPVVTAEYRMWRRRLVEHSLGQLQRASTSAVQTLERNLADEETPPAVQVAAAKAILDYSVKAVEIGDLQERLEALEQALGEQRMSSGGLRAVENRGA